MIVALAIGLALGIQAFVVKPYQIPSRVDGADARRRPAGARQPGLATGSAAIPRSATSSSSIRRSGPSAETSAASSDPSAGPGRPAPSRPPRWPTTNFIKRVVAGPGDRLRIEDGHPDRQRGRAAAGGLHQALPGARRLRLPGGDHDPARPLLHDGRQPWRERRQPLLGTGPPRLDHRRGLLHLLAAGPNRPPLRPPRRRRRRAGGEAVPLRPRVRCPLRRRGRRGRAGLARRAAGRGGGAARLRARSTLRDRRALGDLDDSKQRTRRGARGALPGRRARRGAGRGHGPLRARDRRARPARDQPRRARPQPRAGRRPGRRLPHRRVPGPRVPGRAPGGDRRRRAQRRDRGRLGDREGDPGPLHAPDRRRLSRASASTATSATRPPSTARRSSSTARRRSTAAPSPRSPTRSSSSPSGSPSPAAAIQNAPLRCSRSVT